MGKGEQVSGKPPAASGRGKEALRRRREAEALKRNLARRKAQARGRADAAKSKRG